MTISIHITTKDRPAELALLLQSLRTQTYQDWDLVILDESDNKIENFFHISMLFNRICLEGHGLNIIKNERSYGVCAARQKLIDEDYFENDFICRLDDDVIIESDYLERLMNVLKKGYDIASGVTPSLGNPGLIRQNYRIDPIINKKEIDQDGYLVVNNDDCGVRYLDEGIYTTHEFRSCALFKKEVFKKINYPKNLSVVGFREEGFISLSAQMEGFKIGVDVQAIAWHFQSPLGGCRYPDYPQKVQSDDKYFKKWIKENKEKLKWMMTKNHSKK